MSNDTYQITNIQPEWVLESEALGSKVKFWYRHPDDKEKVDWLFKYPQKNTGQHWAEKVAAGIAGMLGVIHAPVELAVFQGTQGSTTKSFRHDGSNLFHGNQILDGKVLGYDPKKEFKQSEHTLENIFLALDKTFTKPDRAKMRFLDHILLDAIIGNTDRHHENWGILLKRKGEGMIGSLAPTFDHASSLGRELLDEGPGKTRRRILDEDRLGGYSEKGRGAIYWTTNDRHGLSPLELVRRSLGAHKDLFNQTTILQMRAISESDIENIVKKVPTDWMSETAREFAVQLVCYNLSKLREVACD